MIDERDWQAANQAWLDAAALWLQRRFAQRLAPPPSPPSTTDEGAPGECAPVPIGLFGRLFGGVATDAAPVLALPSPERAATQEDSATAERAAAAAMADAARVAPPPALLDLAERFGLGDFERDVLLLAVLRELEPALFAAPERAPSFALAMVLFDDPAWDALNPARPLRAWELIQGEGLESGAGRVASPIVADERVVSFAKGMFHLDARIAPWFAPLPPAHDEALPESHRPAAARLRALIEAGGIAMLAGADRAGKRALAAAAAGAAGMALYRLRAEALPADVARLAQLARLWHRETLLARVGLLIEAEEASDLAPLRRFVGQTGGFVAIAADAPLALDFARAAVIALDLPSAAEQRAAWAAALGAGREALAARLAEQYRLGAPEIAALAAFAAGADDAGVARIVREQTRPATGGLLQRIDAKARREDLVLPAAEQAAIDALIAQVGQRARVYDDWGFRAKLNRGFGITALFAGPSGTGKTMAAEVIAHAVELDLYRIDLASVVSKYIGETEKQLGRVFDIAERGGALLLFDEADALFGKRSEVKDSHDRYANIEIDYLLQRLEAFSGVALLTTNMPGAIDAAFTRRLRFVVRFPYPGPAERRRIWRRALPPAAPTDALDLDRLARLDLSGGDIHAVALAASFAAAAEDRPIAMVHMLDAARRELRKLDRPVNEAELRDFQLAGGGR